MPAAGGDAVDDAVAGQAGLVIVTVDPDRWRRIRQPADPADHREHHALSAAAAQAKRTLQVQQRTVIPLPALHLPAVIDRAILAELTTPALQQVTAAARQVIADADIDPSGSPPPGSSVRRPPAQPRRSVGSLIGGWPPATGGVLTSAHRGLSGPANAART